MIGSIILMILLSPWFWSHPVPQALFNVNIPGDIQEARSKVVWERGKTNSSFDTIFINWPVEFLNNRISILAENFDIGNYFFSGHPRERVGIIERQKFFVFQFVLLIIGLTSKELKKYKKFLLVYIGLMTLATFIFEWRTFQQTILLSVPFILIMSLGFRKLLTFQKKWIVLFILFSMLETISFAIFYFHGYLK